MVGSRLRVSDRWFLIASLFAAVRASARRAPCAGRAFCVGMEPGRDAKRRAENFTIVLQLNLTRPRSLAIMRRQGGTRLNGERVTDEMAGRFGRRAGVGGYKFFGVVHRGAVRCL